MGLKRWKRLHRRRMDAIETKQHNTIHKHKERARRDARMLGIVREGSLPYTPDVMSWLSRQLDKPAGKITAEDLARLGE